MASYEALGEAYRTLLEHGVRIERAMDHVNQRSIYFVDPDGNRLEIYYEMPGALARFPEGRGDQNCELAVSGAGEPLPAWLSERWPGSRAHRKELLDLLQGRLLTRTERSRLEQKGSLQDPLMQVQEDITDPHTERSVFLGGTPHGNH